MIIVLASAMLWSAPSVGDVIRLRSGAEVLAIRWWLDGEHLVYETESGTIGIPRSEVLRIVPQDRPDSRSESPRTPPKVEGPGAAAFHLGADALERREYDTASGRFLEALRQDPDLHAARLAYALSEMALGRDVLATSAILEGLDRAPQIPEFHEVLGDLYDRDERGLEAVEAWREAFALAPADRLRDKILRGERELEAAADDRSAASAHFTVRLDRGVDPQLTADILDYLEHRHEAITHQLRHAPPQPIVVVMYPDREFREVTQAPDNVAGLYDGKIRIPLAGVETLDARGRDLLSHELTHAVVHSKTRGNCPRWLHEGLAQRFEGRAQTSADRAELRRWLGLSDVVAWDDDPLSYPAAVSFVRFLEEAHGFDAVVRVLEDLGDGKGIDEAFSDAFGGGLDARTRAWRAEQP